MALPIFQLSWATVKVVGSLALAPLLVGHMEAKGQTPSSKPAAIEVAREYIRKNLPNESQVLDYEAMAFDRGEDWIVSFMPPGEPRTGGVPEIFVDKKSLTVKKVGWAQ